MKIYIKVVYIPCPACGEDQEGFFGDPRRQEFECDECDMEYSVPEDTEIEFI